MTVTKSQRPKQNNPTQYYRFGLWSFVKYTQLFTLQVSFLAVRTTPPTHTKWYASTREDGGDSDERRAREKMATIWWLVSVDRSGGNLRLLEGLRDEVTACLERRQDLLEMTWEGTWVWHRRCGHSRVLLCLSSCSWLTAQKSFGVSFLHFQYLIASHSCRF